MNPLGRFYKPDKPVCAIWRVTSAEADSVFRANHVSRIKQTASDRSLNNGHSSVPFIWPSTCNICTESAQPWHNNFSFLFIARSSAFSIIPRQNYECFRQTNSLIGLHPPSPSRWKPRLHLRNLNFLISRQHSKIQIWRQMQTCSRRWRTRRRPPSTPCPTCSAPAKSIIDWLP